jgi:hypothetical protein
MSLDTMTPLVPPSGPEPPDKSATMYANLAVVGLALSWAFTAWDEVAPLNLWQYARVVLMATVCLAWLPVVGGLDGPTAEEKQQSEQNLQKAVSEPAAKGAGVSTEW